ncbi:hypothetical protein GH714_040983 [Hevea brasiliensis]|uniref:BHLH domain-containing protein n=1 Tax=Hevea brasiliensis TaxID=3981 RepID=A0A6A6N7S3_HEVBR|nr:hypothetical protein GH714_040983 [Hevea brasiliensis]
MGHPTNTQNLGFCDINVQHNASTINPIGIGKGGPASLRSGIDKTLDIGWNPPSSQLKGGIFLPTTPGVLPQSLSQFPADSAFIERAASTHEVFAGSGLKSIPGGQGQKNVMNMGDSSKDASLSVEHVATEGSPLKNERRSGSFVRSHDEAKQGGSGNESEETEFSGGGRQEEQSMLEGNGGELSAKSPGLKKRKRNGQDADPYQANGNQQSIEAAKDNPEVQQKGDENPASTPNKTAGKQGKQGSQASDPPKEVRREKISERMKFLQDLVPGCSKVIGKAVMLDEIINYVQSLQRQVEFLSMKLATVPRLDFNIEGLHTKDILHSRAVPSSNLAFSPEVPMVYPPFNVSQPGLIQGADRGILVIKGLINQCELNCFVEYETFGLPRTQCIPYDETVLMDEIL